MNENETLKTIYDKIKKNGLSRKEAAANFENNLNFSTFSYKMRKFCEENNLASPFKKRGRPKVLLILKETQE
jgi:hypothetical protein